MLGLALFLLVVVALSADIIVDYTELNQATLLINPERGFYAYRNYDDLWGLEVLCCLSLTYFLSFSLFNLLNM